MTTARRGDFVALKLNHLHLKTGDPDRTARFYVDQLGAKIVSQSPGGGYHLDLHGLSLNVTNSSGRQAREQIHRVEHMAIHSDELDSHVAKKAQDIQTLEQSTASGRWRVCLLEGPDGVQLQFVEAKKS